MKPIPSQIDEIVKIFNHNRDNNLTKEPQKNNTEKKIYSRIPNASNQIKNKDQ